MNAFVCSLRFTTKFVQLKDASWTLSWFMVFFYSFGQLSFLKHDCLQLFGTIIFLSKTFNCSLIERMSPLSNLSMMSWIFGKVLLILTANGKILLDVSMYYTHFASLRFEALCVPWITCDHSYIYVYICI